MDINTLISFLEDEIEWWSGDAGCHIKYEEGRKDSLVNVLNYIKDNS